MREFFNDYNLDLSAIQLAEIVFRKDSLNKEHVTHPVL